MKPILPPAMLGLVGGGPMSRQLASAARSMGYAVAVLDPDGDAPAHDLAHVRLVRPYADPEALNELALRCMAVMVERESLPTSAVRYLQPRCRVTPSVEAVAIAQDRLRQKRFLRAIGLRTAPFAEVLSPADRVPDGRFPALLKTARNGHDGCGQALVRSAHELGPAWHSLGGVPCILEKRLSLETEISVTLARSRDGGIAVFPVAENRHHGGVLTMSLAPARVPEALASLAIDATERIARALNHVGVLCAEFFVAGGELYVNEFAPRPHASANFSTDACATSQFGQHILATCARPLGPTGLRSAAATLTVLGEAWRPGEPVWGDVLGDSYGRLHSYGSQPAAPGRKMAHVTVLADDLAFAERQALAVLRRLSRQTTRMRGALPLLRRAASRGSLAQAAFTLPATRS